MRILVTGGAGYIGSHTCKLLAAAGHNPIVFDNLSTGHRAFVRYGSFYHGDLTDRAALDSAFKTYRPDAVVHFAASAYVGESVRNPRLYYRNNVIGTSVLLDAMAQAGIDRFVFSSSCATYGVPGVMPINEQAVQQPINPYGRTKLICEHMARDMAAAEALSCIALRYFNAAGAHRDGSLGEDHDPETHVIPLLLAAMHDDRLPFTILGSDYDTPDGTCIRDYLHVEDLASAHLLAIEALTHKPSFEAYNLGTGTGSSIKQLIAAAEAVTGRSLRPAYGDRRPGDPPVLVADASKATDRLGWKPQVSDLPTILGSAWNWMQRSTGDS